MKFIKNTVQRIRQLFIKIEIKEVIRSPYEGAISIDDVSLIVFDLAPSRIQFRAELGEYTCMFVMFVKDITPVEAGSLQMEYVDMVFTDYVSHVENKRGRNSSFLPLYTALHLLELLYRNKQTVLDRLVMQVVGS